MIVLFAAIMSPWTATVSTNLETHAVDVSALLLELDESNNPITLHLDCEDGTPDFEIDWYGQRGPDMMVVEYGEGDQEKTVAGFKRDRYSDSRYHYAGDVRPFMAQLIKYKTPTFLLHYSGQARLWSFDGKTFGEAWEKVSSACRPISR